MPNLAAVEQLDSHPGFFVLPVPAPQVYTINTFEIAQVLVVAKTNVGL